MVPTTIDLISVSYTKDSIGQTQKTETKTTVFADETSVSRSEFFDAGLKGLKPSKVFNVWTTEYSGQETIEHSSIRYSVYRTYDNKDGKTELYCQVDKGA